MRVFLSYHTPDRAVALALPVRARWERDPRGEEGKATAAEWALVELLAGPDWRLLVTGEKTWDKLKRWLEKEREFLVWRGEAAARRKEYEELVERHRKLGYCKRLGDHHLMLLALLTHHKNARWREVLDLPSQIAHRPKPRLRLLRVEAVPVVAVAFARRAASTGRTSMHPPRPAVHRRRPARPPTARPRPAAARHASTRGRPSSPFAADADCANLGSCLIVYVDVFDADKLGAAVPEPPKGFHLSGERLQELGRRRGSNRHTPIASKCTVEPRQDCHGDGMGTRHLNR